jgi:hypothetical protein
MRPLVETNPEPPVHHEEITMILFVAALSLTAWAAFDQGLGQAETVRFSAKELENQEASWSPHEVVLRRNDDSQEGFVFILDNPTNRTHVFEAPGVLEQIAAKDLDHITRPLRVTVAPRETMEVVVRFAPVEVESDPLCPNGAACYRYYCPLHRGDNDAGGTILLIR